MTVSKQRNQNGLAWLNNSYSMRLAMEKYQVLMHAMSLHSDILRLIVYVPLLGISETM